MAHERTPIVGILGKRGSGKTLLLTYLLWYYAKRESLPIFTNYGADIPNMECTTMDTAFMKSFFDTKGEAFLSMKGGLIGIDEFPVFLDAYDFRTKASKVFSYFVVQTRKRNVSLFYTAQQPRLVPIRIRDNTDLFIYPRLEGTTLFYDVYDYEAPFMSFKHTLQIPRIDKIFGWYDTEQIIQTLED